MHMPKTLAYIAHPVSGDTKSEREANIKRILKLCREIHLTFEHVIPFAPYITNLHYLDDDDHTERFLGMQANKELFVRKAFDELWLCGDHISRGMETEIMWCLELEIHVKCYHPWLQTELFQQIKNWKIGH